MSALGRDAVTSHNGMALSAVVVGEAREILDLVEPDTTVVAIDEEEGASLMTPLLFDWAIGELDMDFRGEPFGPVPILMAQAEKVDKLQAICVVCGAPAGRTQRLINGRPASYGDPVILVGAEEVYEARRRGCHVVAGE